MTIIVKGKVETINYNCSGYGTSGEGCNHREGRD